MKIKHLITVTTLVWALFSCERITPEEQSVSCHIPISMEQPDGQTKVDVTLNTGALSWSEGDQISVYIAGPGAFRNFDVNPSAGTVYISLTGGESLDEGYSFYPTSALIADHGSGETPWVNYPKDYDLSAITETLSGDTPIKTTVLTPMIAKNSMNGMKFYQTGGMLRLVLRNVPAGTNTIKVTFKGMTDVVGVCSVTNPGTAKASSSIVSGNGNVITLSHYTPALTNLTIPLPSIDFSNLTSVWVEAYEDDTRKALICKDTAWGMLKHGYGRLLSADFTGDILNAVRMETTDVTLWRTESVNRKAKPIYADGMPYKECTLVWSTPDTDVVDLDSDTGLVTALKAGTATITATATANLDGQVTVQSNSYTVYVNEITGVTLASTKASLSTGEQAGLTATVTHTGNGTVTAFPTAVANPVFESSQSAEILINAISNQTWLTNTSFTVSCVIVGGAISADGTATLTVTEPAQYCTGGVAKTASVNVNYTL